MVTADVKLDPQAGPRHQQTVRAEQPSPIGLLPKSLDGYLSVVEQDALQDLVRGLWGIVIRRQRDGDPRRRSHRLADGIRRSPRGRVDGGRVSIEATFEPSALLVSGVFGPRAWHRRDQENKP
ncbi:hypothetical protein EYF80_032261 [Liparis tanakae]|uniref:Uncharacterized protein n=1 Tax=Liparis tanakae TaxID=230148 RepID=A0A4Z2GV74_9TELE|nr:hypothetical protein EYF80_032261 [Liparis tanakae]